MSMCGQSTQGDAPSVRAVLRAPAKINLGLRIIGTRPDGYHLLESLFVPIGLEDDLSIEVAPVAGASAVDLALKDAPGSAGVALGEIPTDERNLAVRAAQRFIDQAGLRLRVSIELIKRIPAGAGLGGGSSDAGAVLRGLSQLHPDALSKDRLAALALSLGADVPFFLDPGPALVSGIGEKIAPVSPLPPLAVILANPGESVATAQVYEIYDALASALTPAEPGSTMRAISGLRSAQGRGDQGLREALGLLLENDLEPAAVRLCPPVGRVRRRLEASGALAVGMSGSGATLYGVFSSATAAASAHADLNMDGRGWARSVSLIDRPARGNR
jgi:4-diphosphocytidyl-2-C-methyl-D-erythritol kinase